MAVQLVPPTSAPFHGPRAVPRSGEMAGRARQLASKKRIAMASPTDASFPQATNIPAPVTLLETSLDFPEVRQVHAQFVVSGLLRHTLNGGRIVASYVAAGCVGHALSVFESIPCPDVFAYNTIIRGFTEANDPFGSLHVWNELLNNGLKPDNYTFTFVLKACSRLRAVAEGEQVHCLLIKAGKQPDTYIHSSLIHMYSRSGALDSAERVLSQFSCENTIAKNAMISGYFGQGHVDKARALFEEMEAKDVASWSAMVTGYTNNARYTEALRIFRVMMASRVSPNEPTLVSYLSACAHTGSLEQGTRIHAYVDNVFRKTSVTLGTALIDMYAKCGCIESSYEIFTKMRKRDVITWGAIISGFSVHGLPEDCFRLFDEMVSQGIRPNEVIFSALLSACSHSGQVDQGCRCYRQMVDEFNIVPTVEHYGCMVDLLGRAGRLVEAENVIKTMPMKANSVIWGAFLSACRMHSDTARGSAAFKHLTELEPSCGDRYKLAALMYGSAGEKENARTVRAFLEENNLETSRGISSIEIDGVIKEFAAGTIPDRRIYEIWAGG